MPVSLANGTVDVSLPIYEVKEKGLSIPILMRYDGSGFKPNQRPSWVGTNWSLHTGGVVTRIVNGLQDEIYESPKVVGSDSGKYSYIDNYEKLNRKNWATYFTEMDPKDYLELPDLNPDEFYFSMNGYSGSFFKNHLGDWVVKSNSKAHYKIDVEYASPGFGFNKLYERFYTIDRITNKPFDIEYSIGRIVLRIEITTPDGVIYSFGGRLDAIDFVNSNPLYTDYWMNEDCIANAWKLTKITHPNGGVIKLNYERKPEAYFTVSSSFQQSFATNSHSLPGTGASSSSFRESFGVAKLYTTYIKSIETSNEVVEFNREDSNQKDYDWAKLGDLVSLKGWMKRDGTPLPYPKGEESLYKSNARWPKLSSILVKRKEGKFIKKRFLFLYNDTEPTIKKRLFLKEIRFYGKGNANFDKASYLPYKFSYIPGAEYIPYTTRKVDHWGYFNNNDYFLNPNTGSLSKQLDAYTKSRDSNFDEMKKGALSFIEYPTGLSVNFDYEPHRYSKIVKKSLNNDNKLYAFDLELLNSNRIAGGLRIRGVNYFSLNTGKLRRVSYAYNIGRLSSGILGGVPNYFEEGFSTGGNYYIWSSYPAEWMSETNGSHISYSKVRQENTDLHVNDGVESNGYTEFVYSNYDNNLYKDIPVLSYNGGSFPNSWRYDPFNRRNMLRGVLLSKENYSSENKLVAKDIYNYTINDSDYTPVRAISKINRNLTDGIANNYRIAAFENSTPFQYLSEKISYTNYLDGLNPLITRTNYQYNPKYKLLVQESLLNSKEQVVTTNVSYPFNYSEENRYAKMIEKNMIVYPVHKLKSIDKRVVGASYFNFKENYQNYVINFTRKLEINRPITDYVLPYVQNGSLVLDQRLKGNIFNKYDERSNLIEQNKEGRFKTFLWGYSYTSPIAKIENAVFEDIKSRLSEKNISYEALQLLNSNELKKVLDDLRLNFPKAYFTTYMYDYYDDVSLLRSIEDVRGHSFFYGYDEFFRLSSIQDNDRNLLKYYLYVERDRKNNK
ncbi:YD repeat-containing protein [Tenacibaculum maritimum]|uniref:hypothetical protein n=1 Tax=Tenacibaculum maritimum TaxID=107401 RepID=UPI0012E6AA31|nr:hypothetical protein [Tenacibaculum maritimum]CAA0223180.1 YD repeat-containing protein [Tenacibaculum maritimum]